MEFGRMTRLRKQQPIFKSTDPVPSDPLRVLSSKYETPGEIHKRTGLDLHRLCDCIAKWHRERQIVGAEIRTAWCTIPVFRFKTLFDVEAK
jgi:hypothetical protein